MIRETAATAWVFVLFAVSTAAAQDAKPVTTFTGDLGYVSATGNTNLTTLSVGEKIGHTDGRWALSQLAAYVRGETNEKESANQLRVAGRADFGFRPRLGVFGGVSFERNKFAGFDSRTDEIVGLRWRAVLSPADSMNVDAGGQLTQESDLDGTRPTYSSARFALAYKHLFSKQAYFVQLAEYSANLETSGAYRVNTESAVVAPISAHVGIKINYAVRFDSRPPVNFGSTDRVLTMGIQLSW